MKDDLPDPRQLNMRLGDDFEEASARELRDVALTAMWVFGFLILMVAICATALWRLT